MESIHFNKDKPENHNIYISNLRDNHVLIYNGSEWQLRERDDVPLDLVYIKSGALELEIRALERKINKTSLQHLAELNAEARGNLMNY
jgi:hypothetical protein